MTFPYKSCSNCQGDDLLLLLRTKGIHWQLLLKQDSQSLPMSWKITLMMWASPGCTALWLLKRIKQSCVLVIMCWAKWRFSVSKGNNCLSTVSWQNRNTRVDDRGRQYLEESLLPEGKGSFVFWQNFMSNALRKYHFAVIFGCWAPKAC